MSQSRYQLPVMIAVLLIAAMTAWLFLVPEEEQARGRGPSDAVRVMAIAAETTELTDSLEALGTARANEAVIITSQSTELIASVEFEDGDQVAAGDILVTLQSSNESARVAELQVSLSEAKRQLARLENLATGNATSRSMLDEQASRVDTLEAQIDQARANLSELTIQAPFAGVLGHRQISPGTLITPGMPITTLDDVSIIKLDFSVPETFISGLSAGQLIETTTAAWPEQSFTGRLTSIGSRVDPVTRAVPVRSVIDNSDQKLKPGMLMTVRLIKNRRNALVVPESAVFPLNDGQFLYRVEDDLVARRIRVTLGDRRPGLVEIIEGLSPGDRVVIEGGLKLSDGQTVELINTASPVANGGF